MTDLPLESFSVEVDPLYEEPVALEYGGIAWRLDESTLGELGARVVSDFERDDNDRSEWKEKAESALERAAQEKREAKDYPFPNASNVSYPMLTVAALQFQARAYPAIVKNDEAVQVKVFGSAPEVDPMAQQIASQEPQDDQQAQQVQQAQQIIAAYAEAILKRKSKQRRAKRVSDYLNYTLFYGMSDWESDTDAMLFQLPIVGCAFRKTFQDPSTGLRSVYVPAMNVVVPQSATSLETTPRITEIMQEVYPYQIKERMRTGFYVEHELFEEDDDQQPRTMLEQYRLDDLDEDGIEEPYIVTVERDSGKVMRVEPGWTNQRVENDTVLGFDRFQPYTLYSFIPDPKGRFYPIGFGHLLDSISDVVNTTINQMIDAGHAQIAGGGFIASGLRIQGAGQTNTLRWRPGEYKTVQATAQQLREGIYERTFPNPSAVAFNMLEMMLGAAKDITATSEVLTGQAPATAPVGTTMALIEQGLQVFTSIYKRIYRALKYEFRLLYDMVGAYGDPEEYLEVVDDPEADLMRDFSADGRDILPVSDPTVSTKVQEMARAQFLLGERGKGGNDREMTLTAYRAIGIDAPETYWPPPQPNPQQEEQAAFAKANAEAEIGKKRADAMKSLASAQETIQKARQTALENGIAEAEINALLGGVPGMADTPDNQMGSVDSQGLV